MVASGKVVKRCRLEAGEPESVHPRGMPSCSVDGVVVFQTGSLPESYDPSLQSTNHLCAAHALRPLQWFAAPSPPIERGG